MYITVGLLGVMVWKIRVTMYHFRDCHGLEFAKEFAGFLPLEFNGYLKGVCSDGCEPSFLPHFNFLSTLLQL